MRTQLADWEGQIVQFTGYVETWKYTKRAVHLVMLDLMVRTWDTPIADARYVDHLCLLADGRSRFNKLKNPVTGTGRVRFYTRRDGTQDYGIDHISRAVHAAVVLDNIYSTLGSPHPRTYRNAIAELDNLAKAIEAREFCGHWGVDPNELMKMTQKLRQHCADQVPYEERREAQLERAKLVKANRQEIVLPKRSLPPKAGFAGIRY